MQTLDVAQVIRETMMVILQIGAPPLLVALLVGVVVSLVQAVTQITEATLSFVPKLLGLTLTLLMSAHFIFMSLQKYTLVLFDRVVAAGGS
jgi:flagellar biosynthetic protein FliQ